MKGKSRQSRSTPPPTKETSRSALSKTSDASRFDKIDSLRETKEVQEGVVEAVEESRREEGLVVSEGGKEAAGNMLSMIQRPFDHAETSIPLQGPERDGHGINSTTLKRQFDQVDSPANDGILRNDGPPTKRQMINGDTTSTHNGTLTNGHHHIPIQESQQPQSLEQIQAIREAKETQELISQTLAEINIPPQLYHVQDNIVPLSLIWQRMAQETHNELEELIADLSNLPTPQLNGYINPRNDTNIEKKNRIWDFAHKWRTKFIQLGVLTAWSTNAEAVGQLIDISFWLTGQRTNHREFIRWMGELVRMLSYESIPAPDIKTALTVMSTGKAEWVSHLGYIPEKPLTPEEMLKSLKTLNTLLTIRLITQEEIPYHFSKWTVKDGRVTFRVEHEFDLDLAIASEDPASQFYFIDLRFLFSPASKDIPKGPAKASLEWRINQILLREGLQACYEFLHELVLEHKLTILRNQARKMTRGQWAENTRLCASNRGIVIQYWMDRPGKKSWIEIGVSSGIVKGKPATGLETSHLNLRWHRHGVDVPSHGIELDVGHISLERILTEVIANHTNHIFRTAKRILKQSPIFSKDCLMVKHRAHIFNSRDCSLTVQLSKDRTITINQDTITGMLDVTPTSRLGWSTMIQANKSIDPAQHLANQLGILRCNTVLEDAVFQAKKFGWQERSGEILTNETKLRLFKSEKIRYRFYQIPEWPTDWFYLAFTTTLEGDNIWLVEMEDKSVQPTPEDYITGRYQRLKSSIPLKLNKDGVQLLTLDNKRLIDIEQHSAMLLSQRQDCRWLQTTTGDAKKNSCQMPDAAKGNSHLYVKYPIPNITAEDTASSQTWCTDTIKIRYMGLGLLRNDINTCVSGQLSRSIPKIQAACFKQNGSLIFNPAKNIFTFRTQTALGQSTLEATNVKLGLLGSLIRFLETTHQFGFVCQELSLNRMTFSYSLVNSEVVTSIITSASNVKFTASISCPDASKMRISFSKKNPHLLIEDYLNKELNKADGMVSVARLLCHTLPLVHVLCAVRESHAGSESPLKMFVNVRSCTSFQIRYYSKTVMLRFEVMLRNQGEMKIHINQATSRLHYETTQPKKGDQIANGTLENRHQSFHSAELEKMWGSLVRKRGDGWYNLGRGLICEIGSIGACIRHLDTAISAELSKVAGLDTEIVIPTAPQQPVSDVKGPLSSVSPRKGITATTPKQGKAGLPNKQHSLSSPSQPMKATPMKPEPCSLPTPKPSSTQSADPPRSSIPTGQATFQLNMPPAQQARMGPGTTQPSSTHARNGHPNFRPGSGQQTPAPNAAAMFQAQQRVAQGFNAPQANMAPMRPSGSAGSGSGPIGTAPQANMQNKRPQASNPSPPHPAPEKASSGQTKNQPITLE